jgi:hypothetical protein
MKLCSYLFLLSLLALPLAGCVEDVPGDDDDAAGDDDDAVACENNLCILSGTITEDLTLTAEFDWLLRGGVFIGDDETETVLTIEAGTTIYGESSTDGMLVIRRGSKIMAEGTADAPIVMTSSKTPGSRARGDWGGLIINGHGLLNACGELDAGEICEAFGEGGTGFYGGDDNADNSGVLRYVRVEFAGTLLSPDNELNGIAFQAVGSGTTIEYIQVHMNSDDGVEFYGGAAQAKYVLTTGIGDDNLDWTDGWVGKLQYFIAEQYDDNGDNGIEADNNGDDNAAAPFSQPQVANVTLIGSPDSDSSDVGVLLREGTRGDLTNFLVTDFNDSCLDVDHEVTFENADAGELNLSYATLDCVQSFKDDDDPATDWFNAEASNATSAIDLTGYTPSSEIAGTDPSAWDSFFDAATFQGAIGPDGDWTEGWTTSEAN